MPKRLFQGGNNVTKLRIKPASYRSQVAIKNGAPNQSTTLPNNMSLLCVHCILKVCVVAKKFRYGSFLYQFLLWKKHSLLINFFDFLPKPACLHVTLFCFKVRLWSFWAVSLLHVHRSNYSSRRHVICIRVLNLF